jgi:hypothetical protein
VGRGWAWESARVPLCITNTPCVILDDCKLHMESSFEALSGSEKLLKVEDVQEAYIEHKDRCVACPSIVI